MITAFDFCIAYVIVDVLCLILTVIIASNVSRDSGSELQVRYFFLLLTANLIFDVFDATWAILVFGNVFEPSDVFLSIVNGVNVVSIAFAGYFWFGFSLAYFESKVTNNRVLRFATALPAFFAIVLHIVGYFTNQNVIFSSDGTISYGITHTIITVIPLLYLVAATGVAIHKYLHSSSGWGRRMCLVFILFMLPPGASGIFDMLIPDMPVAAAGVMISIAFVMMALQESRISNDALTGLNNRRRANFYLEECLARASSDQPVYLFMIDMDHFKSINDTRGHLEGDHALQLMAEALRNTCAQTNTFAARWGGDEFVVIDAKNGQHDPDEISRLIEEELARISQNSHLDYELACSVGYAKCDSPQPDSEHMVMLADSMLYKEKHAAR